MQTRLILASTSPTRAALLRSAGVEFDVVPARVDEDAIRAALSAEGVSPRDQADVLAEHKARRVASSQSGALVIGCDQILDLNGAVLSKPENIDAARSQLLALRDQTHRLFSAVVIYDDTGPVWRHVGEARLTMRNFSDAYLASYLRRAEDPQLKSVGVYQIESEGLRLFSRIDGDYFTILGLPLLPLLSYLGQRGIIET